MSDSDSDSDGPEDIRSMGRSPSGPPKPPTGGASRPTADDSSDDDSSSDGPEDIRSLARGPSGPPKPPTGGARAPPTLLSDDSSSESDDSEAQREAAREKYRREEEAAAKREHDRAAAHAQQKAQEEMEKSSEIPDDFDDSDTVSAPAKGSCSGNAPALKAGAQPPNDLQATLKDKKFKEKVKGYSKRFNVGYADTIGKRHTMEDKLVILGQFSGKDDQDYFAVFDGHGGHEAAAFANKHLHNYLQKALEASGGDVGNACRSAFASCQAAIEQQSVEAGTTAIVALVRGGELFVANLGDARAVLIRRDGTGERASYDHKPHDPVERARVEAAGGVVTTVKKDGVVTARVNGMLAVSRSLGDNSLRRFLTCEPQMHGPFAVADYAGLVLACDGVWDVLSDNTAARVANEQLAKGNLEAAAVNVRDKAFTRKSRDNISVLVVQFGK